MFPQMLVRTPRPATEPRMAWPGISTTNAEKYTPAHILWHSSPYFVAFSRGSKIQGRANHEVQTVNWNTGIFEAESA